MEVIQYPDYFNLMEYVDKIRLDPNLLLHLEDTNQQFEKYFQKLAQYKNISIVYFWIDSLFRELTESNQMEGDIPPKLALDKNVFFDSFQMSRERINSIHKFVSGTQGGEDWRESNVVISGIEAGKEKIFFVPPESKNVPLFMDDFIRIYRDNDIKLINSNPFLKSALMHLLFIKIHPYTDGNGRTARMIQNIKFTELLNNMYGTKLRLSPLNLSQNFKLNKSTYAERLNDVPFSKDEDMNPALNRWLDYVLMMADEQLYYVEGKLDRNTDFLKTLASRKEVDPNDSIAQFAKRMRLSNIK